jgi:hypothetical protein
MFKEQETPLFLLFLLRQTKSSLFFGDTDSDAIGRLAYDNSDNSMRFTTNATERMRIDSSGRLLVNTTASRAQAGLNLPLFVEGTNYTGIGACYNAANSTGSFLALSKSRGAANGSNTIVNNNDQIGEIYFSAADGTDLETRAATIAAFVDGVPGSNDMPGRLVFSTTADGAATPTERMRLDSSGNLKFDSGFGSVATAYGCRAWVNFNGTGTVAIRDSGNVSSITDHTTGEYTINFTTAMPDANYSAVGLVTDWHICLNSDAGVTTSSCRFYVFSDANGSRPAVDESSIHIAVFR